ncbi:hypothetical protein D5S18_30140 [Nocardia panacis]|uniref:Uncharacterized protein n=1 Tax=Nocardia panacis TaxID=2340916 RepID=A0A3A4JMU9_9NOCA|nr:hypothetical protein [Nocardia panacis]RJO70111.1 hypothetical protein D5S18_30140 [Nocardia panacis]
MTTATRVELRTAGHLSLARAISSFQNLIVFDNAWTGITTTIEQVAAADETALTAIVGSILSDLEEALLGAAWLQDYVVDVEIQNIREAALAAASRLPDSLGSVVQDVDQVFGNEFGAFAEVCYTSLRDGLREQRSTLVGELARLLAAEQSEGDLFKNILCGIASGMTVGGLVATAVPPHVTGPIIVGAGATALKAFKCDLNDLAQKKNWRFT